MAIYAVRRENETVEKLINRFKKQTQGTRLVQLVRAQRYNTKTPSRRLVRLAALKRTEHRARRAKEQFYA